MTEEKRPEERVEEQPPLDEKALEDVAGGILRAPHTRKLRTYGEENG